MRIVFPVTNNKKVKCKNQLQSCKQVFTLIVDTHMQGTTLCCKKFKCKLFNTKISPTYPRTYLPVGCGGGGCGGG